MDSGHGNCAPAFVDRVSFARDGVVDFGLAQPAFRPAHRHFSCSRCASQRWRCCWRDGERATWEHLLCCSALGVAGGDDAAGLGRDTWMRFAGAERNEYSVVATRFLAGMGRAEHAQGATRLQPFI
jgi:hypothetical protein